MDSGELGELSRMAQDLIGRIERATGHVAYNYFLHSQPFDMPAYDHYHWHIEIIPRLTKVAGFEWGTGCFINPYSPEAAAEHLRAV
jgi:UDPglucose--hexose-1-phosphate uridylyltransferase